MEGGQGRGAALSGGQNVPRGQMVAVTLPAGQLKPAPQGTGAAAPAAQVLPAGHKACVALVEPALQK